jgi:YesN/AraC family two-component response regulator
MHHRNFSGIQPAVSYIETYFYKNITLVELAEMSRLSIPHFRRVFKEIYKVPPIKYLNFVRINKAKDMIMSRMYSISEIAEKTGYPNVYYFSRVFKKLTGSSPKAYEKMGG